MTSAALIVVTFGTSTLDLTWAPEEATKVIVCNDGRPPDTSSAGEVEWITPDRNLGYGAAVNIAARATTADRLVVVNPDCELLPTHWDALANARDDEVVVVPLVQPPGSGTTVASPYPGRARLLLSGLRARERLSRLTHRRIARPAQEQRTFPLTTHWFSGAAFSISRTRFLDVGGFDEAYFLYWEDVDLSRRLAAADPSVVVRVADTPPGAHHVGASGDAGGPVALERLLSARRYAATTPGTGWSTIARGLGWVARATPGSRQRPPEHHVAVVSLGRMKANGERRRVRSWLQIADSARLSSTELTAPPASPRRLLRASLARDLLLLARGDLVPEAVAIDLGRLASALQQEAPTTIVCVTARAYHPRFARLGARVVLDYVDRLSDSYADRARASDTVFPAAIGLRLLAWSHRRFERRRHPSDVACATGWVDAQLLDVDYVPIVASPILSAVSPSPDARGLVFVGTLDYAPNVEALRFLAECWSMLLEHEPTVTLLVAGARPGPAVIELVQRHGWELRPDFDDPAQVYADARVAVAPLTLASGMQIKVQDALAFGVPVVATSLALSGYAPDIPVARADTPQDFVDACIRLLRDEPARQEAARRGSEWLRDSLDASRHTALLEPSGVRVARG